MELALTRKGITANTIRAGVTMTPALMKIPEHDMIIASATKRNPTGRMTTPQDVANAILALSGEGTDFINGEIIGVDAERDAQRFKISPGGVVTVGKGEVV